MRTMAFALPTVLELLFQLSPLFLGYACFGMVVWGAHCARFAGLWESILTLYAVVNGDIIQVSSFVLLFLFFPITVPNTLLHHIFERTSSRTRS